MKLSHHLLFWSGMSGMLCACDPQNPEEAAAPTSPVPAEAATNVSAQAVKSAHFDTVVEHLDVGGTFLGYIDVAGDLDRLLEMGQQFMGSLREQGLDDIPDIQLKELVAELGLQSISAMGGSSLPTGDGYYRNQAFIHTPDGPKGLLTLFGQEAKPLATLDIAPAGSDIVVEQEFRLAALKDIALGVYAQLPEDQGIPPLDQMMQQQIPGLGMTVEEVLNQANGRCIFVAKIDPEQKVTIPGPQPVEIPAVDFFIDLQGMGWVFEKLQGFIPQQGPFVREDTEAFTKLSAQIPPEVPFSFFQPVLVHEKESNRLMLASRPTFLDACKPGEGDKLATDPDFAKVSKGLPTEGNGFSYISPRMGGAVRDTITKIMEEQGITKIMEEQGTSGTAEKVIELVIGNLGSMASVTVKKPIGIHSIANSPASLKTSLASAASVPAAMGFFTVNAFNNAAAVGDAQQGAAINAEDQLDGIKATVAALRTYAANNGSFPDTVSDLAPDYLSDEDAQTALQWMTPNGPETLVYFGGLSVASDNNPIILASPVPDGNGQRAVAHIDGTVETVSEDDFFKLARAAHEQANSPEQSITPGGSRRD